MLAGQMGGFALIALGRRMSSDGSSASAARVLSGLYLTCVAALFALAVAPAVAIAVPLIVISRAAMAAERPFFTMWVNRGLDPRTRATVLSSFGQADSIGQVAQAPLAATIVALGSVRAALAMGALLVLPAAGLVRTRQHDRSAVAIEEGEQL